MKKTVLFFAVIFLSLLTLQAKPKKKNTDQLTLLNTKWILEDIFETPILHTPDTAFIIFYSDYKISGNLGCNNFFGTFSFGKKTMKLDYYGSTKKLCFNMETEAQFSKAIKNDITHYSIEKDHLYLLNKSKVICKFKGK
ncbi:MAG: META domain-containing protein [Lentimicrobiaceae bacterium]|nr:META domain-containing protein [Lentimicrobiaceae bacterium]